MSDPVHIDEGFYSRQLYVLGHDAMRRLAASRVLIAGMKGLGVEIAKNVILSGVKSVTVQDEGLTQWRDLSSQFYLNQSHLGQNRAACTVQQLSDLNPYVAVHAHTEPLDEKLLRQHQVVVLTNSSLDDQKRFGEFCHSHRIKFIVADTRGLCGQLFCDFGEDFLVVDPDGQPPASVLVQGITQDDPGVVVCVDELPHCFSSGCRVVFSEVGGMTELNNTRPMEICIINEHSFTIGSTSSCSKYTGGGVVTAVKEPITLQFKPIPEALLDLQLLVYVGNPTRNQTLHLAFQALHRFVWESRRLPDPWSQTDAEALLRIVWALNDSAHLPQLDEEAVRLLSYTAQGDLAPVNAFIGGLAAQEVIKACSSKFIPVRQWLYFDALECLPEDKHQSHQSAPSLERTRYDGQILVFGPDLQEKLGRQQYFLVGAGAIGCELLKNFALMGLGAGEGRVTVTDMDFIEKSNLNRQFLFRHCDINKPKSVVAANAVKVMNPQMNITAHQNRLGPDSEISYDHNFFHTLDGTAAALDNIDARVYLDELCLKYKKSLLEGGTRGTQGHTLVVVPHLTESYGRPAPSSSEEYPLCTLKNFPNRIEHTLQWARDQFEGLFKQTPENVNLYVRDPPGFMKRTLDLSDSEALEILDGVRRSVSDAQSEGQRPANWADCVQWARRKWQTLYHDDIVQLLHCFPPEQLTESGVPFWSGSKKCPRPLTFDPDESSHLDYVVAAANLYAQIYKLQGSSDRPSIRRTLEKVHVASFTPSSSVKIHLTDQEMEEEKAKDSDDTDKARLEELKGLLASLRPSAAEMYPIDFEKDDDTNFHMDYVVAASNLRAENYGIPTADRHKSKGIAGQIIPAIATTTAAVAGLMCLELYKLVQGHRKISSYRVAFLNLGCSYFVLAQPGQVEHFEVAGKKFTVWDDFLVDGRCGGQQEMTLGNLLQHIKDRCGLTVCMLTVGRGLLYDSDDKRHEQSSRYQMRVSPCGEVGRHQQGDQMAWMSVGALQYSCLFVFPTHLEMDFGDEAQ
ncbi:ubiquitin-like modifier-activating enzyme 1 isoform X1 [Synchiropus splendidus]|uniref:ubiquitin-like modifier-activating enzyme 1 isoform X1 n=1 Tax=Synchiropus splendidus TaxID=270530 RepID=UPI00237ECFB8|nr:ubiquitin-like modifier-activating enzyme 1 isoform X1 [Synchiropus splendidus]